MRWLSRAGSARAGTEVGRDQRGATSVTVALVSVVLLAGCAIAIDVAALMADRQQLQVGADAAALAIAQDCAAGECGPTSATAQHYVTSNSTNTTATGQVVTVDPSGGRVTVEAAGTTTHWFAPVLGIDATDQAVRATAAWGAPVGGPATLPLTFGWCEWQAQTGGGTPSSTTPVVIRTTKTSETGCTGPSGLAAPGGFGWLAPQQNCVVPSQLGDWLASSPGNSPPCDPSYVADHRGQVVMLPIFDQVQGTGGSTTYHVMGYAAFQLTGYYFAGQYSWNPPCGGNDRCLSGYFVEYVASAGDWEFGTGGPDLGARVVRLTN